QLVDTVLSGRSRWPELRLSLLAKSPSRTLSPRRSTSRDSVRRVGVPSDPADLLSAGRPAADEPTHAFNPCQCPVNPPMLPGVAGLAFARSLACASRMLCLFRRLR